MSAELRLKLERSRRPRPLRVVQMIRLAARLAAQYAQRERAVELPALPQGAWRRLDDRQTLLRRYRTCDRRLDPAMSDLERRAVAIQNDVDSYLERLRAFARRPSPPTIQDLYAELAALDEEFDDVDIDLAGKTLSVVTQPIELEEVGLGRFRIVLRCDAAEAAGYEVVAQSPNQPSSSDFADVVHPHVKDESLCEGDAHEPIRSALQAGRLCDFFVVVDRTLKTYNPGSAYARLAEWDGVECQDCGGRSTEERALTCRDCGDATCCDCNRSCHACDNDLCDYCAKQCSDCGRRFCGDCLVQRSPDGGGLCSDCLERREDEDEEDPDAIAGAGGSPAGAAPEPSFHALRVGEADVSA